MKTFKINNNTEIICEWKKTRVAFKHEATLLKDGVQIDKTKICYQNRTWERYDFESVLRKLLGKTNIVPKEQQKKSLEQWGKAESAALDKQFGLIGAITKMGEILTETKKESNDWKTRMLKAGLENKGLIMPEDWETLPEETKETRLNQVIVQLA